ncbi:hypothetical protein ASPZODRAFT_130960 [Penicilliopsis zonata CBS 506.65]|uniref:UDP-N-acetylglucosamine transferase subunit ALG14 n=1 Tax=Penicilliopsis zonata CBS 506.65 TaxID=1073090 RepID=A0A1L9SJY4_9EURO|nr:hypothetical protein ASPZODRAFT_130960 [Penicilliopsis zonata CBS 506.65]OJJ47475.1 hypothetical protein ASPZODRAFT_130960 [Penicilliopsis zonata CBS 506.65]
MDSWESLVAAFFIWVIIPVAVAGLSLAVALFYALSISQNTTVPRHRPKHAAAHLLIVLGSGGHTAEMFSMLRRMELDPTIYTYRTYIVSSGDKFSAAKAVEFENNHLYKRCQGHNGEGQPTENHKLAGSYGIVTVPRARRVHQSFLTAPASTLQCFWQCLLVLRGIHRDQTPLPPQTRSPYPDLILTNGPATAVCVILAAKLLRLWVYCFGSKQQHKDLAGAYPLRTIFVESWARVTTLSLSGKLLLPFVDRFLVQWPALEGKQAWKGMRKTEYVGTIVD